jgi:iron(II)-dependent oxidoreductase
MRLFSLLLLVMIVSICTLAQDTQYRPSNSLIPGPTSREEFPQWLSSITRWRAERRVRIGYVDSEYNRPELAWTQTSFIQPQMMVEDRYFYDPDRGVYTVDRYLDDLEKRYGGIDSVLLWPVYPNVGIDNRSQFDLLRDLPGGIPGIRKMIADFHRRNVRVLFPMMPWDTGTRREGKPFWDSVAELMAEAGADGVNGDTMAGVPHIFRTASDKTGHPVAFEPENATGHDEVVGWNNLTWGYFWRSYTFVPGVSLMKWLEPRHMVNVCNRWARDKTDDLQYTFFNGTGYESWENVWGIWNGITERDSEALRRMATIERKFARFLVSQDWEPHTPMLQYGIFASKWPLGGEALWTIVNRNQYNVSGRQLAVSNQPGVRYFDIYHGRELQPEVRNGEAVLSFDIEAFGFGAILATSHPPADLTSVLDHMRQLTARPLSSYSHDWKPLLQRIVEIPKTSPANQTPEGMVLIPGGEFEFRVSGIEIEGHNDVGVDVQYPWEDAPRRHHLHTMHVDSFFIDKYPVTNEQFQQFLRTTNYRPKDSHHFLKDWQNGRYPEGWARKPVTWVSIEDARAYASWAGKRLPHEWEWQYAAQGKDRREYPWGNQWNPEAAPKPATGHELPGPADVDAHPRGASPFGVMDLTGNVWQWTDEFVDEHTRAGILRGGSYYRPQGSHWYFPQAYKLNEHGKYLLMAPAKDRSGTVGFRCVKDRLGHD